MRILGSQSRHRPGVFIEVVEEAGSAAETKACQEVNLR
jgi:hypothetical protein